MICMYKYKYLRSATWIMNGTGEEQFPAAIDDHGPAIVGDGGAAGMGTSIGNEQCQEGEK